MNIIKEIGLPAMLEQCAEECTELAKASLKLARKYRNENPTPRREDELLEELKEEIGDVVLCINLIVDSLEIDREEIIENMSGKTWRWKKRIQEHGGNMVVPREKKDGKEKDSNTDH